MNYKMRASLVLLPGAIVAAQVLSLQAALAGNWASWVDRGVNAVRTIHGAARNLRGEYSGGEEYRAESSVRARVEPQQSVPDSTRQRQYYDIDERTMHPQRPAQREEPPPRPSYEEPQQPAYHPNYGAPVRARRAYGVQQNMPEEPPQPGMQYSNMRQAHAIKSVRHDSRIHQAAQRQAPPPSPVVHNDAPAKQEASIVNYDTGWIATAYDRMLTNLGKKSLSQK